MAAAACGAAGVRLRVAILWYRRIPGRHRWATHTRRGTAQHPAMAGKRRLTTRPSPPAVTDQKRAIEDPARQPPGVRSHGYWRARLAAPLRSTYFWILPVAVLGSSVTNVTPCGALK